jgi:hypothetical protein
MWPRQREWTKHEPERELGDLSFIGAKKNESERERREMVVYLAVDARSTAACASAAAPGRL